MPLFICRVNDWISLIKEIWQSCGVTGLQLQKHIDFYISIFTLIVHVGTDDHSGKYGWPPVLNRGWKYCWERLAFSAPLRRWRRAQPSRRHRGGLNGAVRPCRVQTPWAQISVYSLMTEAAPLLWALKGKVTHWGICSLAHVSTNKPVCIWNVPTGLQRGVQNPQNKL